MTGERYMGRTPDEIVDALALWDAHVVPKHEAITALKRVREDGILNPYPELKEAVTSGMITIAELIAENEKLRRERDDLRMFCKGMATNIQKMLE